MLAFLCRLSFVGRGLYHSHPESANAKSRGVISGAQNERVFSGRCGWTFGPRAGGEGVLPASARPEGHHLDRSDH